MRAKNISEKPKQMVMKRDHSGISSTSATLDSIEYSSSKVASTPAGTLPFSSNCKQLVVVRFVQYRILVMIQTSFVL